MNQEDGTEMYVRLKLYRKADITLCGKGYHVTDEKREGDGFVLKVVEAPIANCSYKGKMYVFDDAWEEDDESGDI